MALSEHERCADWFRRFANAEGLESPRYREWALGIAGDPDLIHRIVRLPVPKRQPVLVLTSIRFAGVPLRPFDRVRDEILSRWEEISEVVRTHSTQTNDPRRCAPLLAALDRIRGPIALIDVGTSAGLTLFPDFYSYIWNAPGRTVESRSDEPTPVILHADVSGWGANPPRRPRIVYREGIDLNPLDVTDADDAAWLEALVWPEQADRLTLVRAASDIVATHRPLITAGDAVEEIRSAVARARRAAPAATVVVASLAVLVYLDPSERVRFERYCRRAKVRWVSLDGREVMSSIRDLANERNITGDFLLSLDGTPIAGVDPLGRSITLHIAPGLTPEDVDLIEFERIHWGTRPSKESIVRRVWKWTLVRYYQRLYGIMETTAARRYDPVLVRSFGEAIDARVTRR